MAALGRSLAAATPEPADEMTWRYRLAPEGEDRRERVVVVAKHRGEWLVEQGSW